MSGLDVNRFVDLSDKQLYHLKCPVCHDIFDNAVNSDCRHSFCKQCVQTWIESKQNCCPKCKKPFGRKRPKATNNNNSIIIGNFVFGTDFAINGLVNDSKVKCSFQYNGCQSVVEFGLLSTHLKECGHKVCKTCELDAQPNSPHICIEVMKNAMKELRDKNQSLEKSLQTIKEVNQKQEKVVQQSQQNPGLESDRSLKICCNYILLGNYNSAVPHLESTPDGIKVYNISPNNSTNKFKYHLLIPFIEMQEIIYCTDPSFPVLIILTNEISCQKIQDSMYLGNYSPNSFKFNVNSNVESERYIKAVLNEKNKGLYENWFSTILGNCKKRSPTTKCKKIDLITTRQMMIL